MAKKSTLKLKDYLSEDGKLDLSILNLKAVPSISEILALRKVKSIDLSNNQIESLPDDFIKLEGIHTLDLSKNRLTVLPENFGQIKSLKQLDLFENQLTDLPISFSELTKLEYLDLKNNPLDADLQQQAGKCLNKKECRACAERVLQYMGKRKEEFDKEEAVRLKKKQANDKAKAKKREKQAEKEREEKRAKRLEQAEKRKLEKEQRKPQEQGKSSDTDDDDETDGSKKKKKSNDNGDEEEEGWISQMVDGVLNGLLISLMGLFAWELYLNRQATIDVTEFYKYV